MTSDEPTIGDLPLHRGTAAVDLTPKRDRIAPAETDAEQPLDT